MNSVSLRISGPLVLLSASVIALLMGLIIGGGADPRVVSDPGAVVRWGLPVAKLVVNLGAAVMAGSMLLAAFALRPGEKEFDIAFDVSSLGAAVLAISSGVTGYLTFLSSFNPEVSLGSAFGQQFGRFLLETELGRVWLITTVIAAIFTVLSYAVRGWGSALFLVVLSLASLVPMATQGHSGSLANHDAAVISLVLHITSAAVWLGGLLALVYLRPAVQERRLQVIVQRYSTIALIAFVLVTVSGIARTIASVTGWSDLASAYGIVLAIKALALVALGAVGVAHRRWFIRRGVGTRATFWTFIAVEFAVMGAASGAAAALARTPAPADTSAPPLTSPAEILTEAPLPPELTLARWLSGNDVNILWLLVAGFGIFFYVAGVRRMRQRGDEWRLAPTISWVAGMLLLAWVNGGAVAVYAEYLHSVDALVRILLLVIVPLLLVLGAPYQLALATITRRTDGSRGIRECLQAAANSPAMLFLAHPVAAVCVFALALWATSATGLLRGTLADPLLHEMRVGVLLLSGCLVARSIFTPLSVRPWWGRWVAICGSAIAVMGVGGWILLQNGLIAANWFGAMGRQWGLAPMEDQRVAGIVILLAAPTLVVVGFVSGRVLSSRPTSSLPGRSASRHSRKDET